MACKIIPWSVVQVMQEREWRDKGRKHCYNVRVWRLIPLLLKLKRLFLLSCMFWVVIPVGVGDLKAKRAIQKKKELCDRSPRELWVRDNDGSHERKGFLPRAPYPIPIKIFTSPSLLHGSRTYSFTFGLAALTSLLICRVYWCLAVAGTSSGSTSPKHCYVPMEVVGVFPETPHSQSTYAHAWTPFDINRV